MRLRDDAPPPHRGVSRGGRLLGSIRRRTAAELQDRLRQAVSARAERLGIGDALGLTAARLSDILAPGTPPDPAALLASFRGDSTTHALPGLNDPALTAAAVRDHDPAEADALLARAERIAAGRFDLMGHRDLQFGNPLDWQLDPVAGLRAPLVHWSRVPYLSEKVVGDHKVVWELNRQQWLVTLGQAYALTGDERWTREMVRQVESWLDANPPKRGINWASSLEVSFRAISWLLALRFLRNSPSLEPALYGRMLTSLHLHGRHLETYLSTYFSPNTHLTGEALGLFYLGTLLPELRGAARWQEKGLAVLEAQLPIHVHPDGVYFEQATQYHRYTTDFYTHLVLLAESNGIPLAQHVRPTLERLLEHLLHLSRPDGTIPLFGDDDGGRLVQLDDRMPDDVRALLAAGALLFGRGDFALGARGDLAGMIWLLGADGLSRYETLRPEPPAERARAFPDGGYHVSRDHWGPDAGWLAVDLGPHGILNCGHAHADALSFELVIAGRPVIVDAGTYSYSGAERQAFRHAAAHNTVVVDGQSSSVPAGPFQWSSVAATRAERWHASPRGAFIAGSHDGYMFLPAPALHRREVLHLAGDYWVVRDRVESAGAHELAVRFHCAPALRVLVHPGTQTSAEAEISAPDHGESLARIAIFGGPGQLRVEDGWVSAQYGSRERAPAIAWNQAGTGPQEVITFLLPQRQVAGVREMADIRGGRGFVLDGRGATDYLLVGESGTLASTDIETDAEWLWLRRDAAGRVMEYVAITASFARVNGVELWRPADRLPWRASAAKESQSANADGVPSLTRT